MKADSTSSNLSRSDGASSINALCSNMWSKVETPPALYYVSDYAFGRNYGSVRAMRSYDFRLEEIESIMGSRTVIESPATTNTRILSHALSNIGLAVSLLNMADVEAPAYFQISPQNHSPWVAVTSIIFLIHSILAVIAKIVSRLHMTGMKTCDWLIVVSTLAAFGETILVIAACKDGLGQHEALIISSQLRRYYQDIYAAPMLFVVSNAFAKASVCFYVLAITPQREIQLACYTLLAITTAWAISFIFALAFQCELPRPWNIDATCIDRWQLFLVLGILNILTDLALVIVPIMMLWRVKAKASKKWQVMALFASRIFVPAFIIPQLVNQQGWLSSDDRTWYHVNATIWTQVVMNVSILTACIPGLKGIIDLFLSGTSLFAAPEQYRTNEVNSGSHSSGLRSRIKTALGSTTNKSTGDTRNQPSARNEWPTKQMKNVSGQHSAQVSSTGKKQGNLAHAPERSESQRSLTEDAIYRTIDYHIEYEDTEAKHKPNSLDAVRSAHSTGSQDF